MAYPPERKLYLTMHYQPLPPISDRRLGDTAPPDTAHLHGGGARKARYNEHSNHTDCRSASLFADRDASTPANGDQDLQEPIHAHL